MTRVKNEIQEEISALIWSAYDESLRHHKFKHLERRKHLGQYAAIQQTATADRVINKKKRKRTNFAGAVPASIFKDEIELIYDGSMEYRVLPKSDGTRRLLFACQTQGRNWCVLQEPSGVMWSIDSAELPASFYEGTLLDLEWVDEEGQIFDVVQIEGRIVGHYDYLRRMSALTRVILSIVTRITKKEGRWATWSCPTLPFDLSIKKSYSLAEMVQFKQKIVPKLDFKIDGGLALILMPVEPPVTSGHSPFIKKFKQCVDHTIDLEIQLSRGGHDDDELMPVSRALENEWSSGFDTVMLYLFTYNNEPPETFDRLQGCRKFAQKKGSIWFTTTAFDESIKRQLKFQGDLGDLQSQIVEVQWVAKDQYWRPVRLRTDKKRPNSLFTALATVQNVREDIQWTDLFPFAHK